MIGAVTGGRDHHLSLAELEGLVAEASARGVAVMRDGDAPGVDRTVGLYLKVRGLFKRDKWPAKDHGAWPWCGPKRNRAMLEGDGHPGLFGSPARPPASVLFAFTGDDGTADCCTAAVERGIPIMRIAPVAEPRIWNRHHGDAPGTAVYVGRGTPLGNPFRVGDSPVSEVLDQYRRWLWSRLNPACPDYDRAAEQAIDSLTPTTSLVCSCWPSPCHAEVIVRAWRYRQKARAG